MADLALARPPQRSQLAEALRARLGEVVPSLHLIAEGILGADSRIDFVGIEPAGRVVLILIGEEGDDLALVGRAVAQRAWVEPRIRDWIQLAPNLGLRPGAGVRVVLLCPAFSSETLAAAAALGSETISLVRYHSLQNRGNLEILVEPVTREAPHGPNSRRPDRSDAPRFRTGLSHEDLGLTAEEYAEFD